MRLDISLGRGKLKLLFSPEISLVLGLGAHQLRIPLDIESEGLAENSPVSLMGTLWLDGAGSSYLAPWTTEEQVALRTFPVGHKLVASLTDEQLAAIERHRDGKELAFRVDVKASISGVPDVWPSYSGQISLRVESSRWLHQLAVVGAAASLTVVVPAPLAEGDRHQMGVRLREARAALDDGRYGDMVVAARLALETARQRETLHGDNLIRSKNQQSLSQEERWSALHNALYQLTHVSHHDDPVTAGAGWTRADALAVLAATAALIARQD